MSNKQTQSISELARANGLKPSTVHYRLSRGWSLDKALTAPLHTRNKSAHDSSPSVDIKAQFKAVVEELEVVTNQLNTASQYNDALSAQIQIKNKQLSRMFMAVTGTTALAGFALLQLVL